MRRAVHLALSLLVTGCVVTDTGNPPLAPPDTGAMRSMFLGAGQLTIIGDPGAIVDPGGVVRFTDLTTDSDPVDAEVQPDGSFSVVLFAEADAVLRVQHVAGPDRSVPVDLLASTLEAASISLPCLVLEPALEVRVGAVEEPVERSVAIRSECDAPVGLRARTRRAAPPLSVTPALDDTELAPGAETTLRLRLAPSGEAEAVVLLEISAPEMVNRAITVFTTAP